MPQIRKTHISAFQTSPTIHKGKKAKYSFFFRMGSYYYIWLSKHAQEVSTFTQAYITQPLQLTSSTPLGLATGNRSQTAFSSVEVGLAASSKSSHSRGKWYVVFIDYCQEPVSSSSGRVLQHRSSTRVLLTYLISAVRKSCAKIHLFLMCSRYNLVNHYM